ncbi:thymidylate synthase [Candidatus Gracilibacteria bacterium HOT-871]|nr:thymidylate synthase [Candidatus Gracilibacteria bacterium HOT-871]MBB1565226.1 thymidylate synthase [Candidatus Gracilibacteria bacterium]RKW23672.1 MAG: thymidylate synthase [Candidatus Gracilibacteria bacterium]
MRQYLNLLEEIQKNGVEKDDRTGTGVIGIFGMQAKYDLNDGFPLVTTKKTFLRGIIVELIWLIRGETNIKYLVDRDVHIWDEWPFQNYLKQNNLEQEFPKYSLKWLEEKKNFIEKIKSLPKDDEFVKKYGELGPVYGRQWRNFNGQNIDQLKQAINQIKENPENRRIIVSAWNPVEIDEMLLPPCHSFFQFNVDTKNKKLNLQMYQRSADMFLGVPFNIASYSALLLLVSKITGLIPGTFTHTLGDAHIYKNHLEQVNLQLSREPLKLPELNILKNINSLEDLENLEWSDFELKNYNHYDEIKAPVAV